MRRAEEYFEEPLYIHLLRHPQGMIRSFEDAKLDQVFFRHKHTYTTRELAEIIWDISQQNIEKFLREVPAERQFQVRFEELVKQPQAIMRRLCQWLKVAYSEEMVNPY